MSSTRGSKGSLIAEASMIYIMLGLMLAVWGLLWMLYEMDVRVPHRGVYLVCAGLLASGLGLVWVGLSMSRIALKARSSSEKDLDRKD